MARMSRRMKIYNQTISKKMTKAQLKSYIKQATEEINKSIKVRGTGNEQVDKSIKFLQAEGGIKKVKVGNTQVNKIGLGYSKKTKAELLKQARLLKQHIGIDDYTKQGKSMFSEREDKAYKKAAKTLFKDRDIKLSKTEYRRLVDVFGGLGESLLSKLSSDQVAYMFSEKGANMSTEDFTNIIKEVVEENPGLSRTKTLDLIYERLAEEIE